VLMERFLSLEPGGTSWTWRLSGWFDFEGGGRTTMNDCNVRRSVTVCVKYAIVMRSNITKVLL